MKKITLIIGITFLFSFSSFAQYFNKASNLGQGKFNIGLNPAYNASSDDFAFFIHGGYGVGNNFYLCLKAGFGWGSDPYIGFDVEKTLVGNKIFVSGLFGMHYHHYLGLDGGIVITVPLGPVFLTSGIDMDLNFIKRPNDDFDLQFPLWIPLNIEFYLHKHVALDFEVEFGLTDSAPILIGGGVNLFF